MSLIEHTNKSIQSGNGNYSQLLEFGKTDHDYVSIKHESIEELETDGNNRQQETDDIPLSTAAAIAAIMKIKSELKFLCSLQVQNFDNTDVLPSTSSNYTTLEPSFELPIDDTLFLQEILNDSQISSTLDDDWLTDFPIDSFDQLLASNPDMIYKDLTDMPMEQNDEYLPPSETTANSPSITHDEITNSASDSASDDNERDDINRRGYKKSGGPVRKLARFGNKQVIKYSDDYHDRRLKNNDAVKKSRLKAKEKQKETEVIMTKLSTENRTLNDRVDLLMKELQVLKSLYKELNQDLPPSAVKALERANVR